MFLLPSGQNFPLFQQPPKLKLKFQKKRQGGYEQPNWKLHSLVNTHGYFVDEENLYVLVGDGKTLSIGSSDIPVHFTLERSNAREVSFKHKTRADM